MCFSFTLKTDLIKEENSQTLTQMLETSYVLHDFTLLDSLPFSRSSLSVSQQRSGSCYSHGKLPVTTMVRHVSILHWRRTRQRVNTTVLRERYRRRGGTRKRKIQTDKKKRLGEGRKKERYKVWEEEDKKKGRKKEKKGECDQNLSQSGNQWTNRSVKKKWWSLCWHRIILWDEEEWHAAAIASSHGSKCLPLRINWFWHFLVV